MVEYLKINEKSSLSMKLSIFSADISSKKSLPLFTAHVSAGFPSPAEGDMDRKLDLNELLIEHEAATFFVKVEGESMINAHISPGDILIVDRSLYPREGAIIIAIIHGEFTVKRITYKNDSLYLLPENEAYQPIEVTSDIDFSIWGVVTYVIHKAR